MSKTYPYALSLSLMLGFPSLPYADETIDQIDAAKQAYQAGQLRQAVQELQFALSQIQEKLDQEYTKLMPGPLEGWSAEVPQAQTAAIAMMGGGTQVSRRYSRGDRGESVELRILADSPLLQVMSMMLSNPMMMRSEPGTKPYRLGKHRGLIKNQTGSMEWEINLMVSGRILVQAVGQGMQVSQALEDYLKTLDLEAVERAFGN